jgi:hypothetical protein
MRKGIIVIVLVAASYFVFPQEATAADLPAGQVPERVPDAYEILGLVTDQDAIPAAGGQTGTGSAGSPESQVQVQMGDQAAEVPGGQEEVPVEPPAPGAEASGAEASGAEASGPAEAVPGAEEPLILELGNEPADSAPVLTDKAEPEVEPEEEPLVNERQVPEGEAELDPPGLLSGAADLAEPQAEAPEADPVDAGDGSSEDALLAEIKRLMDERDELNRTIDGLKEENVLLAAKAEEAEFYKTLAEGLEQRIAELEAQLADTELELAESAEALLLAQAGLEAYEEAVPAAHGPEVPVDARLGALAAERDAALAARTQAEEARKAAEAARTAAEVSRAATEAVLAEALESGIVVVAPEKGSREAANGYLSGWTLDTSRFTRVLRSDLMDSSARMGTWVVQGAGARQTDASQYFSRLELPLAQDGKTLLYSFRARATGKGWVGLGLHFFVEDVVKRRGYGEGKSLLIWFTRDQAARGVDTTYLQLYRSDNDVVMERMFDAAIGDSLVIWRKVDIVYDPAAEYVAVSVDGVLRIVYKTFFGRTSGATMALRTLGGGVEFADFSVRGE